MTALLNTKSGLKQGLKSTIDVQDLRKTRNPLAFHGIVVCCVSGERTILKGTNRDDISGSTASVLNIFSFIVYCEALTLKTHAYKHL